MKAARAFAPALWIAGAMLFVGSLLNIGLKVLEALR